MPKLHPESALIGSRIADRQHQTARIRSEIMEMIAGTRHAIAVSRILIAEADTLTYSEQSHFAAKCKDPKVRPSW